MVFKGVAGVKNVRTLKNVSKDYLHEVRAKGKAIKEFSSCPQPPPRHYEKVLFNLLRITRLCTEKNREME
jgi:hypothetical protein